MSSFFRFMPFPWRRSQKRKGNQRGQMMIIEASIKRDRANIFYYKLIFSEIDTLPEQRLVDL